ncbi:MDIS1-interacting receptor like kinase 2-like protein, partial [Tanacetum coccineum]
MNSEALTSLHFRTLSALLLKAATLKEAFQSRLFPSEIVNLKNLLHLDLSQNKFTGLIPSSLVPMVNLTYLDLSDNQFSGLIPSSLGSMINL